MQPIRHGDGIAMFYSGVASLTPGSWSLQSGGAFCDPHRGLVEPDERGDPMSPLRWTTTYLRNLAEELTRQAHPVSGLSP